jgi:hypothetical protein
VQQSALQSFQTELHVFLKHNGKVNLMGLFSIPFGSACRRMFTHREDMLFCEQQL